MYPRCIQVLFILGYLWESVEEEDMPDKKGDLKNYVYKVIRERIVNCTYGPGSMIFEQNLTEELKVSRTPVREALNRIEQEGFIRIMPKKGVMVKEISVSDVGQIFQVREEIEPIIVRLAGPYLSKERLGDFRRRYENGEQEDMWSRTSQELPLDTRFHLFIIENCHNSFLQEFMNKIFDRNTQLIIFSHHQEDKIYNAVDEHMQMIDLLLEDRYEEASELMKQHVIHNREAILAHLFRYQR